ncbi:hypothetical protein C7R88_16330 (plasmid) [Plesiomonas shigelloides]|nr:hypothetical protein C7R88_16330 [Plesiomonas shigelloides]
MWCYEVIQNLRAKWKRLHILSWITDATLCRLVDFCAMRAGLYAEVTARKYPQSDQRMEM